MQDKIYSKKQNNIGNFVFDQNVTDVFSDMINRSVPGYASIITMLGVLSQQYAKDNTNIYDLGCSLGAGTLEMLNKIQAKNTKIIAVDNSLSMINKCKANFEGYSSKVQLRCEDIQNLKIENASIVVMNLSLQFINPENRLDVLKGIYKGLCNDHFWNV